MGFPLPTTSESELELYIAQDMFQPQQSALLRIICRSKTKGTESFVISVSEKDIYVHTYKGGSEFVEFKLVAQSS